MPQIKRLLKKKKKKNLPIWGMLGRYFIGIPYPDTPVDPQPPKLQLENSSGFITLEDGSGHIKLEEP